MSTETIWRVQPIDASFHPGILVRCKLCSANGTQNAPPEQFYHAKKHQRGSVELGMRWARDFRLVHHPTCPTLSAQYAAVESAEKPLDAVKNQIYLLEQAARQAALALDRAYLAKLPVVELSQLSDKLQAANIALAQGSARLAPQITALERKVAEAQAVLLTARGESAPEAILAEFEKAMAKYLPLKDAQEPVPPGQQRVNGHVVDVF